VGVGEAQHRLTAWGRGGDAGRVEQHRAEDRFGYFQFAGWELREV